MDHDDSEQIEQIQRFHETVRGYFSSRIIGAVAVLQDGNKSPRFEMASGCVVVINDRLVWLTAGHYLADVESWHNDGILQDLFLLFIVNNSIATYAPLDFNENLILFHPHRELLDVGFVLIHPELTHALINANIKAIPTENFGCSTMDGLCLTQLIGFSAVDSVLGDPIIHEYTSGNKTFGVHKTELKDIHKRDVLLGAPKVDLRNPLRCIFRPLREGKEKTVGGMSGGPIVAFPRGRELRQFRVLGIQSGERNIERTDGKYMIHVSCYDAAAVLESVRRQIVLLENPT